VFVNVNHFHLSLIFGGKAWSQPLELSPVMGSTLVISSLAYKYKTRVEVTDVANTLAYSDKVTIVAVKSYIVQVPDELLVQWPLL
jgi:hypothetical protein